MVKECFITTSSLSPCFRRCWLKIDQLRSIYGLKDWTIPFSRRPFLVFSYSAATVLGGTHHCDGTKNNGNPSPGPTSVHWTTRLIGSFHVRWVCQLFFSSLIFTTADVIGQFPSARIICYIISSFLTEFDNFFISAIATNAQTSTQFWDLLLNFQFITVGVANRKSNAMTRSCSCAFDA